MAMLPTASNSPWVPSSSSSSSSSPSLSFLPWRRRARRSGTACKRRGDTGGGPAASSLSPRCFLRSGCLCSSWQRDPRCHMSFLICSEVCPHSSRIQYSLVICSSK